jgi:hypothetical protein
MTFLRIFKVWNDKNHGRPIWCFHVILVLIICKDKVVAKNKRIFSISFATHVIFFFCFNKCTFICFPCYIGLCLVILLRKLLHRLNRNTLIMNPCSKSVSDWIIILHPMHTSNSKVHYFFKYGTKRIMHVCGMYMPWFVSSFTWKHLTTNDVHIGLVYIQTCQLIVQHGI